MLEKRYIVASHYELGGLHRHRLVGEDGELWDVSFREPYPAGMVLRCPTLDEPCPIPLARLWPVVYGEHARHRGTLNPGDTRRIWRMSVDSPDHAG